ncbi:MAG: ABC transporter substrate-binding protein [Sulfolobales archaeon]
MKYQDRASIMVAALMILVSLLGPYTNTTIAQEVVLKLGMPDHIDNFNPLIGLFAAAGYIRGLLYDTLLYISANGTYIPWLAESYSVDLERLLLRFKIRPGAYWHDGRPITASDVEFTFNLIVASNYSDKLDRWGLRKYVEYVKAVDDRTVEFKLKEPYAPALFYIGALIPPLPKHIWSEVDPTTFKNMDNPVGSGPFKFLRYTPGVSIELVANENYYRGRPKIDRLVVVLYKSTDALMLDLRAGNIDAITATTVAPELVPVLLRDPNIRIVELTYTASLRFIGFNNDRYPFSIREFREAIAYAIDKEAIVRIVMLGYGYPAADGWVQPLFGIWYNPGVGYRRQNLTKAAEILDKLGFIDRDGDGIRETPNGTVLRFKILTISGLAEFERSAELVAGWLKRIGIDATIEAQALGTVDQREGIGDFDIGFMGIGMSITVDLDFYLYERFHSSQAYPLGTYAPRNWFRYRNPELDILLELQRRTLDPESRREIIWKIQEIVARDIPALTLYMRTALVAYRTERFTGWVEPEGPTSKISVLNLSPRKPEVVTIITQVPVTQVREITQVIGGATVVMTQTEVRVETLTEPGTPPPPGGISIETLTLLAVLLVVLIGAIAFLATKRR